MKNNRKNRKKLKMEAKRLIQKEINNLVGAEFNQAVLKSLFVNRRQIIKANILIRPKQSVDFINMSFSI